jgi:hypothetical protein
MPKTIHRGASIMPTKTTKKAKTSKHINTEPRLFVELANFFASSPTREQILKFHPSSALERRASHLLEKLRENDLNDDERRQLDEFEHGELLMRRIKARLRGVPDQ